MNDICRTLGAFAPAIIFSSHHVAEAEDVADHVLYLQDGVVCRLNRTDVAPGTCWEFRVQDDENGLKFRRVADRYVKRLSVIGNAHVLSLNDDVRVDELIRSLLDESIVIMRMRDVSSCVKRLMLGV